MRDHDQVSTSANQWTDALVMHELGEVLDDYERDPDDPDALDALRWYGGRALVHFHVADDPAILDEKPVDVVVLVAGLLALGEGVRAQAILEALADGAPAEWVVAFDKS